MEMGMEQVLSRYLEIQQEERALREEKSALQERIAAHMEQIGQTLWFPDIAGQKLKVRCSKTMVVEYDEEQLRLRLGSRYTEILAPDLRKIRQHLPELLGLLSPFLAVIGSPTADRVRQAVERGLVKTEEFIGAFRKTTKRFVAVGHIQPNYGSPEGSRGQPI